MEIKDAQYIKDPITKENINIMVTINGVRCGVPLDPANRHYEEIVKRVNAGTLSIEDAV